MVTLRLDEGQDRYTGKRIDDFCDFTNEIDHLTCNSMYLDLLCSCEVIPHPMLTRDFKYC